jgi:hypothetical protein
LDEPAASNPDLAWLNPPLKFWRNSFVRFWWFFVIHDSHWQMPLLGELGGVHYGRKLPPSQERQYKCLERRWWLLPSHDAREKLPVPVLISPAGDLVEVHIHPALFPAPRTYPCSCGCVLSDNSQLTKALARSSHSRPPKQAADQVENNAESMQEGVLRGVARNTPTCVPFCWRGMFTRRSFSFFGVRLTLCPRQGISGRLPKC